MAEKFDLTNIGGVSGLSEKEPTEGFNEIPYAKKRSTISITLSVLREQMLFLLVASGIIYMVLGDVQEAPILLGFVFVIIGITLYQELEVDTDCRETALLVFKDFQVFQWSGRQLVPVLAGHRTIAAAGTTALVEKESILCHYAPSHFSI